MLMMRPQPAFCMNGRAFLVRQKAELKLSERTCSHFASGKLVTSSMCCMPALLTSTSTRPKYFKVSSTIFLQSAGLVKSAKINLASTVGYFLAKSASVFLIYCSGAKPFSTMLYPRAAREWAMPKPMPLKEPVTKATLLLFLNSKDFTLPLGTSPRMIVSP